MREKYIGSASPHQVILISTFQVGRAHLREWHGAFALPYDEQVYYLWTKCKVSVLGSITLGNTRIYTYVLFADIVRVRFDKVKCI